MATIINNTYFENELSLPIDNINVQLFIDEHEPIVLRKLLGYALYKEFKAALDGGTPDQKWIDLRDGVEYIDNSGNLQKYDGLKIIITEYVFIKIVRDKQNHTTDSGVKIDSSDNAENYNPRYKQVFAQNDMVDRIVLMNEYINVINLEIPDTYDTYDNYLHGIIEKRNIFNI